LRKHGRLVIDPPCDFINEFTMPDANDSRPPVIGWREWAALPELNIPAIKVKVDTGARSSSLHAYDIDVFTRQDAQWARFKVHPLQRDSSLTVITEAPLLDHRWVKSSGGHRTLRAVVQTDVLWMGRQWPIELTLVRRDQMGFRMLLGREAVRERFVVDPGRSYVGGRGLRPDKRRKKKEKTKESKSPTRKASS